MKSLRPLSLLITIASLCLLSACATGDGNSNSGNKTPSANSPAPPASSPASQASTAVPYPGAVDRSSCDGVGGWVMDKANPASAAKVELYIDGKLVETMEARTLRPDLTSWGSGLYGFLFKIPDAYKDEKPHVLSVKVAGANYQLPFIESISPNLLCQLT